MIKSDVMSCIKLCQRQNFSVAKVLSVLLVYLCHLFENFNNSFQFIVVSVFFFVSGFGVEFGGLRMRSLLRLPRYIAAFFFFSFLYYLVYGVWFFPSAWFLLAYFMLMVLYRFFSGNFILFFISYFILGYFYYFLDFSFSYYVTPFGFVYGVFVARYMRMFRWLHSVLLAFCGFFVFFTYQPLFFIFFIPLYLRLFLTLCTARSISYLSYPVNLVYPFFMCHCFVLGLFRATWTLGGSFDLSLSIYCFFLSLVFSLLLYRFVPFFSKRKFWIFQ